MKSSIFLSYAKEDFNKVREIYSILKNKGLNPWLDSDDLRVGQEWEKEIAKAIKTSRFVMVFLSKNSVKKRGHVQKEFRLALDVANEIPPGQVFILPIRLDDCEIPDAFRRYHCVNLFEENSLKKIISDIQKEIIPSYNLEKLNSLAKLNLWTVSLSSSLVEILSKFYQAGKQEHTARDILNVIEYTVWRKLILWAFLDTTTKGKGLITQKGIQFLQDKIEVPQTLYISDGKVLLHSAETVCITDI